MPDDSPTPRPKGLDSTAKGILAATIGLTLLGGFLIQSVESLDAEPDEVATTEGGEPSRTETRADGERERAAQSRLEHARALLSEGRYSAASAALEQLLALDPDHAEALRLRGSAAVERILLKDDDVLLESALADLARAVAAAPKDADAHAYLGLAWGLGNSPRFEEALETCGKALELDPASARARLHRGVLNTMLSRSEDDADAARRALEDLDPAVLAAPRAGRGLACRSVIHSRLGHGFLAWWDAAAALEAVEGLEARLIPGLEPSELRELLVDGVEGVPVESQGEAARQLATLLESREPETRAAAGFALSRLGESAAAALPALIEATGDQEEGVRLAVSECLARLGNHAAAAEDALLEALEARREDHVVQALAAVSSSDRVLTTLVRLLSDDDEFLRLAAIQALGSLGPKARRAGRALHKALGRDLKRKNPQIAFPAMMALARLMPTEEALPALVYALEHEDPTVRLGAVQALALLAVSSPLAMEALEGARGDAHELVRERAGEELERLGR